MALTEAHQTDYDKKLHIDRLGRDMAALRRWQAIGAEHDHEQAFLLLVIPGLRQTANSTGDHNQC